MKSNETLKERKLQELNTEAHNLRKIFKDLDSKYKILSEHVKEIELKYGTELSKKIQAQKTTTVNCETKLKT